MVMKLRKGWNAKQSAYVFAARSIEDAKDTVRKYGYSGHYDQIKKVTKYKSIKPTIQNGDKYYLYRIDISKREKYWILYHEHGRFIKTDRPSRKEAEKHADWLKDTGCTDIRISKKEPPHGIVVSAYRRQE